MGCGPPQETPSTIQTSTAPVHELTSHEVTKATWAALRADLASSPSTAAVIGKQAVVALLDSVEGQDHVIGELVALTVRLTEERNEAQAAIVPLLVAKGERDLLRRAFDDWHRRAACHPELKVTLAEEELRRAIGDGLAARRPAPST
jgi:hypothetical protein